MYNQNMLRLEELHTKFLRDEFEFSRHALDQTLLREISVQEIRETLTTALIIEDYPNDKYGPSCLLFGMTHKNRPIHIQCTYPSLLLVRIITAYEPNPEKWIDYKIRR